MKSFLRFLLFFFLLTFLIFGILSVFQQCILILWILEWKIICMEHKSIFSFSNSSLNIWITQMLEMMSRRWNLLSHAIIWYSQWMLVYWRKKAVARKIPKLMKETLITMIAAQVRCVKLRIGFSIKPSYDRFQFTLPYPKKFNFSFKKSIISW